MPQRPILIVEVERQRCVDVAEADNVEKGQQAQEDYALEVAEGRRAGHRSTAAAVAAHADGTHTPQTFIEILRKVMIPHTPAALAARPHVPVPQPRHVRGHLGAIRRNDLDLAVPLRSGFNREPAITDFHRVTR